MIVYEAINGLTGKRYVGMTTGAFTKRRRDHIASAMSGNGTCRIFHAAIRKYGADAFSWRVLEEHDSIESACDAERRLIADTKPEYNIGPGGIGVYQARWTEEKRAVYLSSSVFLAHVEKMRKLGNAKNRLKVVRRDTGHVYESLAATARDLGAKTAHITRACRRFGSVRGIPLAYYPLPDVPPPPKVTPELRERFNNNLRQSAIRRRRKIICKETGTIYESVTAAAQAIGCCRPSIATAINRGTRVYGHSFIRAEAA